MQVILIYQAFTKSLIQNVMKASSLPILSQIKDKNISLVITGSKGFANSIKRRSKESDIPSL